MKKRYIYYIATGIFNLLLILFAFGHIRISLTSLMPLGVFVFLSVTWIIQGFRLQGRRMLDRIKYSGEHGRMIIEESKDTGLKAFAVHLRDFFVLLPIFLPLSLFLSDGIRCVLTVVASIGFVVWMLAKEFHSDAEQYKAESEQRNKELEEQKKKEEMGFYK